MAAQPKNLYTYQNKDTRQSIQVGITVEFLMKMVTCVALDVKWVLFKGGLISERFSLWLKYEEKSAKSLP